MTAALRFLWRNPALVLVLIVGTWLAVMALQLRHVRQQLHDVSLAAANDTARRDTTRVIYTADTTAAIVARLMLQEHQRSDDVDRALRQVRVMTADLRVLVAALSVKQASTGDVTRGAGDTLRGHFDVRQPPYTVAADVALPQQGRGVLALHVKMDAAALAVHVGCSTAVRPGGVRDAQLTVRTDSWLTVTAPQVTQDAQVCSPGTKQPDERAWWRPTVSVGGGLVHSGDGVHAGPGILLGWRVF